VLARAQDLERNLKFYEFYAPNDDSRVDLLYFNIFYERPDFLFSERDYVIVSFYVVHDEATSITTSNGIRLERYLDTLVSGRAINLKGVNRVERNERVDGYCFL